MMHQHKNHCRSLLDQKSTHSQFNPWQEPLDTHKRLNILESLYDNLHSYEAKYKKQETQKQKSLKYNKMAHQKTNQNQFFEYFPQLKKNIKLPILKKQNKISTKQIKNVAANQRISLASLASRKPTISVKLKTLQFDQNENEFYLEIKKKKTRNISYLYKQNRIQIRMQREVKGNVRQFQDFNLHR